MQSGAIFDLDGTLLDSVPYWVKTDLNVLAELNIKPTQQMKELFTTMTVRQVCAYLSQNYSLNKSETEIFEIFKEVLCRYYKYDIPAKPGVKNLLDNLAAQNIPMIVATSSESELAHLALTRLGMLQYFKQIITSTQIGIGKTDPTLFIKASQILGTPVCETVVYEDSLYAIKTAKQAGFIVAGVYDDFSKNNWEEIKQICDLYYEHF